MKDNQRLDKIAIIAGQGLLPKKVLDSAKKKGISYELIALDGEIDLKYFQDLEQYHIFKPYHISKIINKLRELDVKNVVLAGKVSRKGIAKLIFDKKGLELFNSIMKRGLNDNSVLSLVVNFLEENGFNVIAPEEIADELIVKKGALTNIIPSQTILSDIKKGKLILRDIAKFDIGQALIINNNLVLGVEAAEGTDLLIKRCGQFNQENKGVLVKICKPNQEKRVDLPCLGINTIQNLHDNGFSGIAIESNNSVILSPDETIKLANKLGVFIYGI